MKKKLKLTLGLLLLIITNITAQQVNIAKAYYIKAKEAYSEERYSDVLGLLDKVKQELGMTNPDITYLELMSLFNIKKRDPQIAILAEEFVNSANPADDRIQKVSLIAVEHREIVEQEKRQEIEAFNLALDTKSLVNLRSFKVQFPYSERIDEIDSLLLEKEELDYKISKNKNQSQYYKEFLQNYPESKYQEEVKKIFNKVIEDEAYSEAKSQNTILKYDEYLANYPTGKYSEELRTLLEKSIIKTAIEEYALNNFENSKNYYNRYLKEFPNGNETILARKKVGEIEKKLSKKTRISNRTSAKYIMATYSDYEVYGLQLGRLSKNKAGTYFNLSVNENIGNMKFMTDETNSSGSPDFFNRSVLSTTFGLSYKIAYPVWIYGGVGYVYSEFYQEQDDLITTYQFDDVKSSFIFPEFGLNLKLGKIAVLKAGGGYMQNELYFNVGIGFQTKNW